MSAEFQEGQHSKPFEYYRTYKGGEVILDADVDAALGLPYLLQDELEKPQLVANRTHDEIQRMVRNIQTTFNDAYRAGGTSRLDGRGVRERMRRQEIRRFGSNGFTPSSDKFIDLGAAMHKLVPDEIDLLSSDVFVPVSERDFRQLADIVLSPGEPGADNVSSRLGLNTPENLEEISKIANASAALALIENMNLTATLLDGCIAYGDDEQVGEAIELLGRMHMATLEPEAGTLDRIMAQAEGSTEIINLAFRIARKGGEDPIVKANIIAFAKMYDKTLDQNTRMAGAWGGLMLARQVLLNDGLPADFSVAPFDSRLFTKQKALDLEREETPLLRQYASKVREYIGTITIPQPDTLSSKQIKSRNLEDARSALVRGEKNEDDEVIVAGRSKAEALEYISNIEALRVFIIRNEGIYAARQQLDATIAGVNSTLNTIDALINEPGGAPRPVLDIRINRGKSLTEFVEDMKADWSTIGFLVENYWPDGAQSAEELRQLLFLSEEELEAKRVQDTTSVAKKAVEFASDEVVEMQPLEAQTALAEIAKQLDEVIFPPRATQEDVKRIVEQIASRESDEAAPSIDWERLFTLVKLRELNGGVLYRSKPGSLGNAPPYFVVAIQADGNNYAVAESPVEGNATYVVSEKDCPGTWLEVLALSKEDARAVGARRVIHRSNQAIHQEKVQATLFDLMTIKD